VILGVKGNEQLASLSPQLDGEMLQIAGGGELRYAKLAQRDLHGFELAAFQLYVCRDLLGMHGRHSAHVDRMRGAQPAHECEKKEKARSHLTRHKISDRETCATLDPVKE
jgi:hypothetical protein